LQLHIVTEMELKSEYEVGVRAEHSKLLQELQKPAGNGSNLLREFLREFLIRRLNYEHSRKPRPTQTQTYVQRGSQTSLP
jgi:hypothetical protein